MKKLLIHLLFPATLLLLINSCVQTPEPEFPKRINYNFFVENVGDTLTAGQDTIAVSEIKLLADKFEVVAHDGTLLQSEPDAIIIGYREEKEGEDELVLSAPIGFEDIDRFTGVNLFIAPAKDNDNIQDNDFFGENSNYSIIIRGIYNSRSFTYRTDFSFDKTFEFSEVELTKSEETLVLRMLLNIEDIFIDESNDSIHDPFDEDNRSVINSLIRENVEMEAFAANRIF